MSVSLRANPQPRQWLDFNGDRIRLKSGKAEIGQGIGIALMQIAADELRVSLSTIDLLAGHTGECPDELWTSASISVEAGGSAVRAVCAAARHRFTDAAARVLNVSPSDIVLSDGLFSAPTANRVVRYADLANDVDLSQPVSETETPLDPAAYNVVGRSLPRPDLHRKLTGGGFIHDIDLPNMVHGRVVLPPRTGAVLEFFDVGAIRAMPGVIDVVQDGAFIAIAAAREEQAIVAQAKAETVVRWSEGDLPPYSSVSELLDRYDAQPTRPVRGAPVAAGVMTLTFTRPFIAHASIGLCCALAAFEGGRLTIWAHSQGVFPLRASIARVVGMDASQIDIIHCAGAGCYGHNGADDVALDAVLLARAVGRSVRMAWTRAQELQAAPAGPAMSATLSARISSEGRINSWRHTVKSFTHLTRPGWGEGVNLASAWRLSLPHAPSPTADPGQIPFGGAGCRNGPPIYDVPALVEYGLIPERPFRTSALRALGAHLNVFAIESMMDELAERAGLDPIAFRFSHLLDERAKEVLRQVAEMAGWPRCSDDGTMGYGCGFARYKNSGAYCATIVELGFHEGVRARRVWAAVDVGLAVNPDGVVNQIEGGIIQALSFTLKEELRWNEGGYQAPGWADYPIIGFTEVPEIGVYLISKPTEAPLGVGECAIGPTAAAVGNAVRQALGVRICDMPISVERITTALM